MSAESAGLNAESADQGASVERTRLAWRRTGLSATAVGLLGVRPVFNPTAGWAKWLVAALVMAGWAAVVFLAYRRVSGLNHHPPQRAGRLLPTYALLTVVFAALSGLVVML